MKKIFFSWGCRFLIFYIINILVVADIFAVPIQTFDTEGTPLSLKEEVKKDPDRFIEDMKTELRYGNLDNVGSLAKRLVEIKPLDPEVRALYSIFLVSKGDIKRARQELIKATEGLKETQYSLYAKAMILRLEKNYDAAIKACKKAIAMDKSHPYPWNILGRIYFDRQEYKKALSSFQKAVELEPNFLPGYINLGAVFFIMGEPTQSINYFKKAIELNPRSHSAHFGMAMVYENMGNLFLAIEELKKSLDLNPDNPSALQKLGELQLKVGKYKDALSTGQEMAKRGIDKAYEILGDAALHLGDPKEAINYLKKAPPDSIVADYLRGFCLMVEGDYEAALRCMESVLQRNKNHFGAYVARVVLKFCLGKNIFPEELNKEWGETLDKLLKFIAGSIYAANENWDNAYKSWQSAEGLIRGFSIKGINIDTLAKVIKKEELRYLNLGALYYFKNLYQNAFLEFEKALKVNKDSILANYWAAQVCLKKADRVEAIQFLKNAIKKAPNFFAALYTLGDLNFLIGKQALATQYYQRALLVKKDAGILIKLGLIFENSKEYEKAERQYEEVIRLYPNLFVGYNQLAWLYAKRGINLDKAIVLAQKANELQPGNASVLDTIGWIHFHKKNYHEALANVIKANKIRPNNPVVLYHLGAIYYAMGNKSAAKENLKKALSISNHFEGVEEARKILNNL